MFSSFKLLKKILIILVVVFFLAFILSRGKNYKTAELSYGATFSQEQAEILFGDKWKDSYEAILTDLGVKKLRIPAYWDIIQKDGQDSFDYTDLDWQINEAEKNNAKIILAVGYRLPRWPECHIPAWAYGTESDKKNSAILNYIKTTIERYKGNKTIAAWQIENEPFLSAFGDCPKIDPKFLDQEIALVKSLDSRQIVVTDSGELSIWVPAAKRADIFGTSLYLHTYSQVLKSYISYPITPGFFHFKKNIVSLFAHPKKWIVIEMQAEPWGPVSYTELSQKEMSRTFDPQKFENILSFGQKAGFQEFYLWGAEWWYWEKTTKNNPVYWNKAKELYSKNIITPNN